jgi:hypothetical protein
MSENHANKRTLTDEIEVIGAAVPLPDRINSPPKFTYMGQIHNGIVRVWQIETPLFLIPLQTVHRTSLDRDNAANFQWLDHSNPWRFKFRPTPNFSTA